MNELFWHSNKIYTCELTGERCQKKPLIYRTTDMTGPNCGDCPEYLKLDSDKR